MQFRVKQLTYILAPLFLAASWFGTAAANGETYQWKSASGQDPSTNTIIGHGGAYAQDITFQTSDGSVDTVSYTGSLSANCEVTLQVPKSQLGQSGSAQASSSPSGCANIDSTPTIAASANAATTDTGKACDGGALSFILCPAYDFIVKTVGDIEKNFIVPFLQIQPVSMDHSYTPYLIWNALRGLADVFFVIFFLIMVFSQTTSLGLDTYSARRLLPRLAAAAILIQFSYVLVAFGIDLANIFGAGIGSIILAPIHGHTTVTIDNLVGGVGIAGTLIGAVALAGGILSGTIFLALITALLGVLLVFITLVFRQILILLLLILSPIAFLLWILPNTEHFFKLWSRNLLRLLIMYPLVVVLFASGQIFGAAINAGSGGGIGNGSLRSVVSVIANVLPLFLLPATFTFAGELMARGHSAFRMLHATTKGGMEKSDAYERFKNRTHQRKADLAAGQGVNMTFGLGDRRFTGAFTSRLGAIAGRGAIESLTTATPAGRAASDVRAMAAHAKVRSEWKKRLDEEAYTFEGYQVLSRGQGWADQQISELRGKVKLAKTDDERASLNGAIDRYSQAKSMASRYRNINAARDAAALWLGNIGQAEEIDRSEIVKRTKPTKTGRLIAGQVWGDTRNAGRSSNVHLAFKDINGVYDDDNMKKYVKKKGQNDWAGFSTDAYKELARNGSIAELAFTAGGRSTLAGILGAGGPQAGPDQQAIILDALTKARVGGRTIDPYKLKKTKGQDW